MPDVVVDASVVVKWYIPERDHEPARDLRDDYLDGTHDLVAPALLPFETINALRYSDHYDGDRLREASESLPDYGIELVPYREVGPVAEIADELDIPIYDASYVALAEKRDSVVFTVDSKLIDALDGESSGLARHIRSYSD